MDTLGNVLAGSPIEAVQPVDNFLRYGLHQRVVAVIGDLMLDRYVHGAVERISPEAPVPILQRHAERQVPGGAANVASNLAALGAQVRVVGVTGADEARTALISALQRQGHIISDGIIVDTERPTTQKLRVMSAQQQIVRIDIEQTEPVTPGTEEALIEASRVAILSADIVVVSDYGKGTLTDRVLADVLSLSNKAGKLVLLDPKRTDWSAYRGAAILTPNRRELSSATGLPCESDVEAEVAVARAKESSGCDILLTRSEKGMSFYRRNHPPIHVPALARDVFDVSGAGDTVIAVLAGALACRIDIVTALRIANHAAGIVVGKVGTAPITKAELVAALEHSEHLQDFAEGQLISLEKAARLRRIWHAQGLKVGFANGCFDLVHPGHVSLIREAAAACDRLIVGLNSDASVARLKGPSRPVQDQRSRATVIGAVKGVSAVVIFDEDTPLRTLQEIQPDVLVKGADYLGKEIVGGDLVTSAGGRVILAELVPGCSTTSLVQRGTVVV